MKYCHGCGKELHDTAVSCPSCGARQPGTVAPVSPKGKLVLAIVCWFVGILGVHRFMVGKNGSGAAQLILTLTIFGIVISGIWAFVDLIMILTGNFRDKNDALITDW